VFAEGQAMRRVPMTMTDWIQKLHGFLSLNDRDILDHAGKISHQIALEHAENEYERFQIQRDQALESDFDKITKKALTLQNMHKPKT
jgi:hypothetical protein